MLKRFSRLDVFLALSLLTAGQALHISFLPGWGLTTLAMGLTVMRWQVFHPVDAFRFVKYILSLMLRSGVPGALLYIAGGLWSETLPILHMAADVLGILAIGFLAHAAHSLSRTVNTSWCAPQTRGTT